MRNVLGRFGLLACVAVAQLGCDQSSSGASGSATPSATAASVPASGAGSAAPAPEKKLITVTTKSADAKAAFMKAWDFWDNGRSAEALDQCKKAVAADAEFALGQACVAFFTPGADGEALSEKAAKMAEKLPDAERLLIQGWAAVRHADLAKYDTNMKKVAEAAPDDYRAHMWAARPPFLVRDFAGAEAEYRKALALDPSGGFIYAQLASAQMEQKKYDDALASAKKYVEASPSEPAAQRTLGDALLHLDKVTDAEAAYAKAVELGPKVLGAYINLATARTILGNFAGARDALDKGKAADVEPDNAIERRVDAAWVSFAEGKDADALKALDAAEKDAETQNLAAAWFPANARALALWIEGKNADAVKVADGALAKCDTRTQSSTVEKAICRMSFLRTKAFAQLAPASLADAQKTVAVYQTEAKKMPTRAFIQTNAELLSGTAAALDKKDAKAPAALLAKARPDDSGWKLEILRLADAVGDKATADQLRKDLPTHPMKDFLYPLIVKGLKK